MSDYGFADVIKVIQMMKMIKWMSVLGAAILSFALLSSSASAVPMDYEIEKGKLQIKVGHHRYSRAVNIRVKGGSFTYDNATGIVSGLTVRAFGRDLTFSDPITVPGNGSSASGHHGRHIGLRLAGLDLPDSRLGNLLSRHGVEVSLKVRGKWVAYSGGTGTGVVPTSPMPEPTAAVLFAAGLFAVGHSVRRRDA